MNIIQRIGRWFNNLFAKRNIEEALGVVIATSPAMLQAQEEWRQIYSGNARWNNEDTPSLFLAAGLCVEFARSVTVELKSEVTGSQRADYLQEQYLPVLDELRKTTEKACAGGTVVLRPFVREDSIHVTTVENNCYFPIRYNGLGELVSVVFADVISRDEKYYTLLEHCDWDNGTYTIIYYAFVSDDKTNLGKPIPLSEIEEWAELPPEITFEDVERPWFSVFKMPQLNHIDQTAPEGVAIFSKAIELLRQADKQHARTVWEYEGSELAVFAPVDMWRDIGRKDAQDPRKGEVKLDIPEGKDRLYVNTAISNESLKKPEVFNPPPRDESLHRGLDRIKRQIEFNCGASYGIISDPQTQDKTATEVRAGKQRFYSTIVDIQHSLEEALRNLIAIMDDMATRYYLAPQGVYDISFQWDDSVIADREREFTEKMQLLSASVLSPVEMRAWYLGVDVDSEGAQNLPGAFDEPETED